MRSRVLNDLIDRFRPFERVVEVGIGHRTDLAAALARHTEVTATDIVDRRVPEGVTFVRDDLTEPDPAVYAGADLVYAINLPTELHRPLSDLVTRERLTGAFTTFGTEGPHVPTEAEAVDGETLYWIR